MNENKYYAFISLLFISINTFANNFETSHYERISGVKVFKKQISEEMLKVLTVVVGTSKLSDIDDNVGTATTSTCFLGKDKTFLRFESSVMGGEQKTITSVKISSSSKRDKFETKYCNVSDQVSASMSIGGSVMLNIARSKVISILGKPSWKSNKLLVYSYEEPFLEKEGFTTNTIYEFYFSRGKTYEVDISRITSN